MINDMLKDVKSLWDELIYSVCLTVTGASFNETILHTPYVTSNSSILVNSIPGIGAQTAAKLDNVGIRTLDDLKNCKPKDVSSSTGISKARLSGWQAIAGKK